LKNPNPKPVFSGRPTPNPKPGFEKYSSGFGIGLSRGVVKILGFLGSKTFKKPEKSKF